MGWHITQGNGTLSCISNSALTDHCMPCRHQSWRIQINPEWEFINQINQRWMVNNLENETHQDTSRRDIFTDNHGNHLLQMPNIFFGNQNISQNHNAISWKCFLCYWPFRRESITGGFPHEGPVTHDFDSLLCCSLGWVVEQIVEVAVRWDTLMLMCCHLNDTWRWDILNWSSSKSFTINPRNFVICTFQTNLGCNTTIFFSLWNILS